ncbi:MAG: type II secretion system protein GspM [Porticoccaceae bacterium]|jgi:type II secretory pathway component PulM|nr:type II secretion system protein GspM [Porticoccaceae bacterium]
MNLKTVAQAFENLQLRERYFIGVGGLLVLTAVIYLSLSPLADKHTQLVDQQSQLQADLEWLHDQAAIVPRLVNSCSGRELNVGRDTEVITKLVRRAQLRLDKVTETGRGISLRVNGSDANRLMRLVHQISCEGFSVQSIDISANVVQGAEAFSGAMEVQRVN